MPPTLGVCNTDSLGGISGACGTEMYLPLWLSLYGTLGTGKFNIAIAQPGLGEEIGSFC